MWRQTQLLVRTYALTYGGELTVLPKKYMCEYLVTTEKPGDLTEIRNFFGGGHFFVPTFIIPQLTSKKLSRGEERTLSDIFGRTVSMYPTDTADGISFVIMEDCNARD